MGNRYNVIDCLKESRSNPLLLLIEYGSLRECGDVDLFVVYESSLPHADYSIGALDVFSVGMREFQDLLLVHDLMVSEPLLTGKLLAGNSELMMSKRKEFLRTPPDDNSIYHFQMRSVQIVQIAALILEKFKSSAHPIDAYSFWKNLSFGVSYFEFAARFRKGEHPVTLSSVASESQILADVLAMKRTAREVNECSNPVQMAEFLSKAKRMLIRCDQR